MKKIFENSKEPLFGRATVKIILKPFEIVTIKHILKDFYPNYSKEDLLMFYMITGGVAKYIEQLVLHKAFTKKKIIDVIFEDSSFFLDEGRAVLIDEFGKDYGNYFSINWKFWDTKGEIEIDIVALNEMKKKIVFYEVKRKVNKTNLNLLKNKSSEIAKPYHGFSTEYKKLSFDDM
jgi:AAA+ ATPase superfamily predicted ATPase